MRRAFEWWKVIEAWRAAHGGTKDIPIRQIITGSRAYARLRHGQECGDPRRLALLNYGVHWLLVAKGESIDAYARPTNAAELVRPLYEDGMGAIVALLVAAGDYYE